MRRDYVEHRPRANAPVQLPTYLAAHLQRVPDRAVSRSVPPGHVLIRAGTPKPPDFADRPLLASSSYSIGRVGRWHSSTNHPTRECTCKNSYWGGNSQMGRTSTDPHFAAGSFIAH